MAKNSRRMHYVCQSCGAGTSKWMGRCPTCGEWETLVEERSNSIDSGTSSSLQTVQYPQVEEQSFVRIESNNPEFNRALGGGIVPGSLILIGGEPGIGKSTLLLQVSEDISNRGMRVLYVAGEESAQQIKLRGDRLEIEGTNLLISPETCIERVLEEVARLQPGLLIVDSIQTVYSEELDSAPGSIGQIRECALRLLKLSKETGIPVFLIGHITKDGALAGPKALEHIVDVVLYFEGDRHQNHKLVRTVKNRFGPANELGIFEMTSKGLICVENPSKLFLSQRAMHAPGSAVLSALQGTRPVLVELQALVSQSNFSTSRRMANGIDHNRLSLLLAMLEKRLGFHLMGCDVYINVAGGITVGEPAVDLAVVAAVVSSFRDLPLNTRMVVMGEVGLAGEVRAVNSIHSRVKEASGLGFSKVILPAGNLPISEPVGKIELCGVASVEEFLDAADL